MARTRTADIIPAAQARTLAGLLLERVRRSPQAIAYLDYDRAAGRWIPTRWEEVGTAVGRWQAALRREMLTPGDRVAIQMANRREWVFFDIAALGLGLATVPLYVGDRPENLRHTLTDSGARLLIVEGRDQLDALAPIADSLQTLERVLVLEPRAANPAAPIPAMPVSEWLADAAGEPADEGPGPDALATVVYTSGTTGSPKGVMLTHGNILWNAEAVLRTIPAHRGDSFLSFLPLAHMLPRTGAYYLPMMAGARVVHARSIPELAEDLKTQRPTVLIAVPRIFERVHRRITEKLQAGPAPARRLFETSVASGWHRFEHRQGRRRWTPDLLLAPLLDRLVGAKVRARLGGRVRIAVSGGAPLSAEVARFFIGLGIPLVQGYGLTEASPVATLSPLEDNIPESVGLALPGAEIRVGERDEILVRSPGVMRGYWRRPRESAAAVDPAGWLHTGDQGRIDPGGHLHLTGRIKEVIVLSTGEKVAPGDLEMAIGLDRLFAQVLIVGEGRPYLGALLVLDPDAYAALAHAEGLSPDVSAERENPRLHEILLARIATRLEGFPVAARIYRAAVVEDPWSLEEGTMTPTMKLKRARILERCGAEVERLYEGH